MSDRNATALLIVGHGSTVNPDSSAPTLTHAAEIRRRRVFADVACAFWKEEPSLRDALFLFGEPAIKEVYVVPNFISEGYFTQTVIPRELELNGRTTKRPNGQTWNYCEPVGNDPSMIDLLLKRAKEIAPDAPEKSTTLIIAAHGTDLNENSAVAAKREGLDEIDQHGKRGGCSIFYFRRIAQLRRHSGPARDREGKIDNPCGRSAWRSVSSKSVQDRQSLGLLRECYRHRTAIG